MTDGKEDEVRLTEEEIDRLLIETLDDPSPVNMNTNEQQNVDELLKLSEEGIERLAIETTDDSFPGFMNTNEQQNVDEFLNLSALEKVERINKEKEEHEESERIKKKNEEREEFYRLLDEMMKDSYPVYNVKKEPVEFDLPLIEMASNSFPEYNIKKEPEEFPDYNIKKEPLEFPDYNIKTEPVEFDLPWNEILNDLPPGYTTKKDQQQSLEELQISMIKQEQSANSRKGRYGEFHPIIPKRKRSGIEKRDPNPPELDPLQIAAEMVIKYHEFVDYTIDSLSEGRGNAEMETQKWNRILKRGIQLVESVNPRMKRLGREMGRMEKDENLQTEHAFRKNHIDEIMKQLRDINARIVESVDFSRVSDTRYTEKVLPKCFELLRGLKEELRLLIQVIQELKDIASILHSKSDEL